MHRRIVIGLAALLGATGVAWAGTVTLHGSSTVTNLIVAPNKAEIEKLSGQQIDVVGNGSQRGLVDLLANKAQIAMLSAPLEDEVSKLNEKQPGAADAAKLRAHRIGETRVAFVVHPTNQVRSLSNAQLAGIFSGKIGNWRDVGGPDLPVVIAAAQPGDGLRSMVESTLLAGASLPAETRAVPNASQVAKIVAQLPGAIGVVSPPAIDQSVAELRGDAPIVQPLILVTMGEETAEMRAVIDAAGKVGKSSR
jgi:phosphate transport system substrate-binding protein